MTDRDQQNRLRTLLESEKSNPGFALCQPFYTDPEIFKSDISSVFKQQWLLVDHVSRIPNKGQYFLFEIAGESIIVIRENESTVNAFYNVCRHRGSRICLESEGKKNRLTCPYHAWSYMLNGDLKTARSMPSDFDPTHYPLNQCHIRVFHGLIFLNLSAAEPPNFDELYSEFTPLLSLQGIKHCKVAKRMVYPNTANWKLVVENFVECYHCGPAHAEYSHVHGKDKLLAFGAGAGSGPPGAVARFQSTLDNWLAKAESLGHLTGMSEGSSRFALQQAGRFPLNDKGWLSETLDGKAACKKLLGQFTDYDGGQTAISFNPVSFMLASNDYAVLFRFTPIDTLNTDIEMIWLVDESAVEGTDYHVDHLIKLWDITTRQDKSITENNQAGILSERYRPGPYSTQEPRNIKIKRWYLEQLDTLFG